MVQVLAAQAYQGGIILWLQQTYSCTLQFTEKLGQGFMVELYHGYGR